MNRSSGRLAGKVALIFGAATGIGAATARRFAAESATVAAYGLRSQSPAEAALTVRPCDVTADTQVKATVDAVEQEYGRIDVLVNAAGVIGNDAAASIDEAVWNRMLDVNLTGTMRTMRAVLPGMLQRKSGVIVNIASVGAFNAGVDVASYVASKAGVVALTRSAAQQYGRAGIRVNALCPGWVDTPMSTKEMQDMAEALHISIDQARQRTVERIALGRMATPDEIAAVCLFLASDDAAFVTGAALVADGGMRIPAAMRAV